MDRIKDIPVIFLIACLIITNEELFFCFLIRMDTGEEPRVRVAANIFRELCYNNRDNLMAGIIVAGWDKTEGGQVLSIRDQFQKVCMS